MTSGAYQGQDDIQRVLDATDIVQLISEHIRLKPAGREFKGLCPFHDDHDPSMHVVPQKGIFKCFSCGTGGDALRFVRLYHHMEFREALSFLAERAGIQLTPFRPGRRQVTAAPTGSASSGEGSNPNTGTVGLESESDADAALSSSAAILAAHQTALSFFQALLKHEKHGSVARELFAGRHISAEMIERFQLGSAPPGSDVWDGLVRTLRSKNISLQPFIDSGLVMPRKTGEGFYDRFRNRLMFPIFDEIGRPIAFGARKINPDDDPKYLNSPEHPRFHKGRTLYGLHLARKAIQKEHTTIVVEGYTDVIACHQAGVENVVATLGTALTREHAQYLHRLCDRVVLIFDGDEAGQRAADRAVEVVFQSAIDVYIAILPEDLDPAEMMDLPDGAAQFRRLAADSIDALEFLFGLFKRSLTDVQSSVSGRQRIIEAFMQRLGGLGFHQMPAVRRDLILARLSEVTGARPENLHELIPLAQHRAGSAVQPAQSIGIHSLMDAHSRAEWMILACIIGSPDLLNEMAPLLFAPDCRVRTFLDSLEWKDPCAGALAGLIFAWVDHAAVKPSASSGDAPSTGTALPVSVYAANEEVADAATQAVLELWKVAGDDSDAIRHQLYEHLQGLERMIRQAAAESDPLRRIEVLRVTGNRVRSLAVARSGWTQGAYPANDNALDHDRRIVKDS